MKQSHGGAWLHVRFEGYTSAPDDEAVLPLRIGACLVVFSYSVDVNAQAGECCIRVEILSNPTMSPNRNIIARGNHTAWGFKFATEQAAIHGGCKFVRSYSSLGMLPARDCWPSKRCVWPLSCCMSLPGSRPQSII